MKFINWKSIVITCAMCLLPIFFGIALWNSLPVSVAVHFNFNNEPDNFASKGFAVFGLPFIMAALQAFCCIVNDISFHKHGKIKNFGSAAKWFIPVMSIVLQSALLGYSLGWDIDMRAVALALVIPFVLAGVVYSIKARKTEQ